MLVGTDRLPRVPGDAQDHGGDGEADERVGYRHAECDGCGGGDDGERDVGVGARVVAVSDQGGRLEALTGARADLRGDPVAQVADRSGGGEDREVGRRAGIDEATDRFGPGDQAEMKIAATTASPAYPSARRDRMANAIPSGMAVRASPALWIRSARSATLPEAMNTTPWSAAVTASTASEMTTARTPSLDRLIESSTSPWLCP